MIIGIAGYGGSGKTLLGVALSTIMRNNGYVVLTNLKHYKFKDGDLDEKLPEIVEQMIYMPYNADKTKYIALVDEIQNYLDSREAMYRKNKKLTKIFFQLRKLKISMIYTCQDFMSVDARLRRITEQVILPDFNPDTMIMSVTYTDRFGNVLKTGKIRINPIVYEWYKTFEFMDVENDTFEELFDEQEEQKKIQKNLKKNIQKAVKQEEDEDTYKRTIVTNTDKPVTSKDEENEEPKYNFVFSNEQRKFISPTSSIKLKNEINKYNDEIKTLVAKKKNLNQDKEISLSDIREIYQSRK